MAFKRCHAERIHMCRPKDKKPLVEIKGTPTPAPPSKCVECLKKHFQRCVIIFCAVTLVLFGLFIFLFMTTINPEKKARIGKRIDEIDYINEYVDDDEEYRPNSNSVRNLVTDTTYKYTTDRGHFSNLFVSTPEFKYRKSGSEMPGEKFCLDDVDDNDSIESIDSDDEKKIQRHFIIDVLKEIKKQIRNHRIRERNVEMESKTYNKRMLDDRNETTISKNEDDKEFSVEMSLEKIANEQERLSNILDEMKNVLYKLNGLNSSNTSSNEFEPVTSRNKKAKSLRSRQLNIRDFNETDVLSYLNMTYEHPYNHTVRNNTFKVTDSNVTSDLQNYNKCDNFTSKLTNISSLKIENCTESSILNMSSIREVNNTESTAFNQTKTEIYTSTKVALDDLTDTSSSATRNVSNLELYTLIKYLEGGNKTDLINDSNNITTMLSPEREKETTPKRLETEDVQTNYSTTAYNNSINTTTNKNIAAVLKNNPKDVITQDYTTSLFKTVINKLFKRIDDLDFTGVKFVKKQDEYQNASIINSTHPTEFSYNHHPQADSSKLNYDFKVQDKINAKRVKFLQHKNT